MKLLLNLVKMRVLNSLWDNTVNDQFDEINFPEFEKGTSIATRKAFGVTLDKFAEASAFHCWRLC